jgi:uncharacterized protein YdhG (YjbR/CyaY superfamily)
MPTRDPKRESHFPAIEKRYGEKMTFWFKVMAKIEGKKYPEQMAHLQENYGFSRAHANALVMYSRGSLSSKRHETLTDYYKSIDPKQAKTIRKIFTAIRKRHPKLEQVIAWNQPMMRLGTMYIFGAGVAKNHILLNPFSKKVLDSVMKKYPDLKVNKHTIQIPNDWTVDDQLILKLVKARLAERE